DTRIILLHPKPEPRHPKPDSLISLPRSSEAANRTVPRSIVAFENNTSPRLFPARPTLAIAVSIRGPRETRHRRHAFPARVSTAARTPFAATSPTVSRPLDSSPSAIGQR